MPVTTPPKSFLSIQLRKSTLNEHRISLSIMMPHIFHLPFKIAMVTLCKSYNSDSSFRVIQPLSTPPKPALVKLYPGGTGMGVGLAVLQRSLSTQSFCGQSVCLSSASQNQEHLNSHVSHDSLFTFRSCCYQILFCIYFLYIMKTRLFNSICCLLVLLLLLPVLCIPLYSLLQFTAQLGSK